MKFGTFLRCMKNKLIIVTLRNNYPLFINFFGCKVSICKKDFDDV